MRANGFGDNGANPGVGIGVQPAGTNVATGPTSTLGATSILAPTAGYVIVRATTSVNASGGTVVALRLQHNPAAAGPTSTFFRATVPAGANSWVTASPGAVFPVAAGYQTFALQAAATGDATTGFATASGITLDALFVPFDGAGESASTTAP